MGFKALTVNTPVEQEAHILAEDDATLYAAIIGGDCVLPVGNQFSANVTSNNNIRLSDGMVMIGGHVGRIVKGDYEDMAIENGVSGQNRNDLIVARFISGGTAGADDFRIVVVKGTPGVTANDPAIVKGDLYAGEKQRDYPLWRVRITGLSVAGVDKLFEVGHMAGDKVDKDEVVDNLTSTETRKPLSANQGRILQANKLDKTGDAKDTTNTFAQAATRANIASGEKHSVTLGKIAKFIADVIAKGIPFMTVVNNGTTTVANTLLDGRMGKTLMDKYNALNSALTGNGVPDASIIDVSKEVTCRYVKIGHVCQVSLCFTPLHTFAPEWTLFTGLPRETNAQDFQYTLYREDWETVTGSLTVRNARIYAWYGNQPKVGETIRCGFTYVCN